ncbi:MAG: cytochrome c oxidase assembly protein [Actinomycetota bacterium]|nr:cytochrome c oxidase assembly protein [Actinomycetota bacterium]
MLPSAVHLATATMHMGPEPAVDLRHVLLDWYWSPFTVGVDVAVVAIAAWYVKAVDRLGARGRSWSPWRTVSFLAGLAAIWMALCSSVATYAGYTFVSHVFQHLLLMIIAPPLAALGAPMTLLLQTSRHSIKVRALRVLHSRPFAVVRHPVPVFFMYYLSMYAFFLTPAIGYAMEHMWLMDLINLGFLFGATLFWWPMLGPDPIPGGRASPGFRMVNLLIGVPVESFLGIAIMSKRTTIAPMYTLASSHHGGAVLWAATEVATLLGSIPLFVEWVRSDARQAKRIDARLDAGQALPTPPPAGAGMGATLRSLRRG